MREISIQGERFVLHPERILLWPERSLLVAADLHMGKAETFLFGGLDESPQDQWRGLLALDEIAEKFSVEHIMFLGDFIHSPHGLTEGIVQDFSDFLLRTDRQVTLIPNNRDKGALKLLGALFPKLEVLYQWQIENFIFQHQPPDRVMTLGHEFYWCGHLNPVLEGKPCFVIDSQVGVLPAYSPVAGGNLVDSQPGRRMFKCDGQKIEEF